MKKILFTMIPVVVFAGETIAQSIIANGGFEGSSAAIGNGVEGEGLPNGWKHVPHDFSYSIASSTGNASADTLTATGPSSSTGMWGIPNEGVAFVSGMHYMSWGQEGVQQDILLQEGISYELSFYQSVVQQRGIEHKTGGWEVYLGDRLLGVSAPTTTSKGYADLNLDWEARSLSFIATSTGTQTLRFLASDPIDDGTSALRMGLDSVSLEATPEPSAALLLGLASLGLLTRRKRS